MDRFAEVIGMEPNIEDRSPATRLRILGELRERHHRAEGENPSLSGSLARNLGMLARRFRLSAADSEVLALAALSQIDEALQEGLSLFERLTDPRLFRLLGIVLERPWEELEAVFHARGPLIASRLVSLSGDFSSFEGKVELLPGLANALLRRNHNLEELLHFALNPAAAPALEVDDFAHVRDHLDILMPFLERAASERRKGVNILVFGRPGVGKTELARLLAAQLRLSLYEVPFRDPDGSAIGWNARMWRYGFLQALLARRPRTAILFDEIEDAMPWRRTSYGVAKASGDHKAWTNRILEENAVPAIWIGNRVDHMDEAFLRRYAYVLELETPPRSTRKRILTSQLAHLEPSDGWLERRADDKRLSPAAVAQIADVLTAAGVTGQRDFERAFETATEGRFAAMGYGVKVGSYPYPEKYRPELVNASIDPQVVAERLRSAGRGNLLFVGPSGSGKTAYAHYLAKHLDRPLLLKRASDLHTPWFGETERLLGEMFREAAKENAVLLLDEADSFLYDRRGAQRSWEIAHVNELLTQMECFEGIFICTTNFGEQLDPAAMRRFAAKVRFDSLKREQVRTLVLDTMLALGITSSDEFEQQRLWRELDALSGLTAGDFSAARKALDLQVFPNTASGLIEALRTELSAKPESNRRPIGFAA